ncbi:pentapeptide repeat-containing protein [Mycobacterium sp. SMC-17]|uniref:pentapeptide repeat-containing protein n=1 Tax=Mycobacterium sp. SMC-17 TaxID=3381628 RepID=UPI003876F36C
MYLAPDSDLAAIHARLTAADNDIDAREAAKDLLDLLERKAGYNDYMAALHMFCELLSRPYLFPRRASACVADVLEVATAPWRPFTPNGISNNHSGLRLDNARLAVDGIDFTGAALQHASLTSAHLYRKTIQGADLTGADLNGALCGHSKFVDCRLIGITLVEAECQGLTITNGDGRPLSQLPACRADFSASALDECVLESVNLQGAALVRTSLRTATLRDVDLRGANLTGANLTGATLAEVDLRGANLTGAYLSGASLAEVDLRGANLTGADCSRPATWIDVRTDGAITAGAELPTQEGD